MNRRGAITAIVSGAAAACGVSRARATTQGPSKADAVGLLYDATSCVGCLACVSGCAEAQVERVKQEEGALHLESKLTTAARTAVTTVKKGEDEYYAKKQCMHCLDPGCVSACMLGALSKDKRGIVSWDGSRCVGCRYCQVACPFNVPRFEWNNALDPHIVKCEMCWPRQDKGQKPACVESCPAEAVIFGKREDLLKDAKQRIADAPDDYFPKVLGEHDAGGTQVLMLSPVDFKELGMPDVGTQPIPKVAKDVQGSLYYGFIAPTVVYGVLASVVWRNHRMEEKRSAGHEESGGNGHDAPPDMMEGEENVGPR